MTLPPSLTLDLNQSSQMLLSIQKLRAKNLNLAQPNVSNCTLETVDLPVLAWKSILFIVIVTVIFLHYKSTLHRSEEFAYQSCQHRATSHESRDVARFFLFLPALCGKEYYSYPHRAGRNRKYIGIPVPLTKNRMLYHQSKLGQEQVFLGMSLGKPVPALASTGGILHSILSYQDNVIL